MTEVVAAEATPVAVRNIKRVSAAVLSCEVEHPDFGWIPFTASKAEIETNQLAADVFAHVKKKKIKVGSLEECPSVAAASLACERHWRNLELSRADIELLKSEDGDGVGVPSDWRAYRKALREWPNDPNFPKEKYRPKAPDA